MKRGMRLAAGWLLAAGIIGLWATPASRQLAALPETLVLARGEVRSLALGLPLRATVEDPSVVESRTTATGSPLFGENSLVLTSADPGITEVRLSLFGRIPLRSLQVSVREERQLIPGGQAIGVALHTRGALVVSVGEIVDADGRTRRPAEEAGLRPGDVILAVNGVTVESAAHLAELVQAEGVEPLSVTVENGDRRREVTLVAIRDRQDGQYRLGTWVRDFTAGVGTLSYIDPESGAFGALGHAITDMDTGKVLEVGEGSIYESRILAIQQGASGNPGELKGAFDGEARPLGVILENQRHGLYGRIAEIPRREAVPIAHHSQVHLGPAVIRTTVDGEGVREYRVEIIRLYDQTRVADKGIVLRVTDGELLSKTGGIVQGMSGSPILQDGRLIGAVTHVLIHDPLIGHGIYIDWMLEQSDALARAEGE